MRATPISLTVARQFLTREAADAWDAGAADHHLRRAGHRLRRRVRAAAADRHQRLRRPRRLAARPGAARPRDRLVQEDGEWRIDSVPDALIVPESWFDDWYERASLYYFDPTSEVLVAEPVFVPRGDQSASSLVRGLSPSRRRAARRRPHRLPGRHPRRPLGAGLAGSPWWRCPGTRPTSDEDTGRRMLAQLAWTLRQDQQVRAVQLNVGGGAITLPEGSAQGHLDAGDPFDPDGERPVPDLYALQDGRVVSGTLGAFADTLGPLGGGGLRPALHRRHHLRVPRRRRCPPAAPSSTSRPPRRRTARSAPGHRCGRPRRARTGTTATACGSSTAVPGGPASSSSSTG